MIPDNLGLMGRARMLLTSEEFARFVRGYEELLKTHDWHSAELISEATLASIAAERVK